MKSYNVLLLVALVFVSISNAFELANLAEVKELRSTAYGNSLIETISLTLQNNGKVEEVDKLLNELLFKLNVDQENATTEWNSTEKTLKEKEKRLEEEIAAHDRTIVSKTAERKENETKRDQAEKNIQQYQEQRAHNDAGLAANEENRRNDEKVYNESTRDHNDIINAIKQVIEELNKLRGSISGKSKPEHVDEISQETRDRAALQKSFVQITRDEVESMLLVEMATSADQDALNKLITLLESLLEASKKSLNEDHNHNENSKANYETLKATLEADNKSLDSAIKDQTTNFNTYKDKVTALNAEIVSETNLRDSKTKEREETIKERQNKEAQYKRDTEERNKEREVIKRLQGIVNDRLASMSKFLKDNTGAF